jgi:hypothetical protein
MEFSSTKISSTATKMPGEVVDRPNTKPQDSSIPKSVLSLSVKLEKLRMSENDLQALQDFRRACNYIAAGKLINRVESYGILIGTVVLEFGKA